MYVEIMSSETLKLTFSVFILQVWEELGKKLSREQNWLKESCSRLSTNVATAQEN